MAQRSRRWSQSPLAVLAAAAFSLATSASAQPTITEIIAEDGRPFYTVSGVSDAGVVCGTLIDGARLRAALWTEGGNVDLIAVPGNPLSASATAISADGRFVIVRSGPNGLETTDLFRWSRSAGLQPLPVPGRYSTIYAVALDGTAVGGSGLTAVRWLPDGSIDSVPMLQGADRSEALAISDDGAIVGWNSYSAIDIARGFIHTPESSFSWSVGAPACSRFVVARAISDGGHTVVGGATDEFGVTRPFRQSFTYCVDVQLVPVLDGDSSGNLTCISRDGSVAAGYSGDYATRSRAMIWDQLRGTQELRAALAARGASVEGWEFTSVNAMSSDGATLVGSGRHQGRNTSFMVRGLNCDCTLPSCITDVNQDGLTDQMDIELVIDCIAALSACECFDGDLNHDGNYDQGDIATIVDVIAGGPCP